MNCNACGLPILPGETATVIGYITYQEHLKMCDTDADPRLVLCHKCGEQVIVETRYSTDTAGFRIYVDRTVRDEWISPRHEPTDFKDMLAKVLEQVKSDSGLRCIVVTAHEDPKQIRILLNHYARGHEVLAYSKVSRSLIVERSSSVGAGKPRQAFHADEHLSGGEQASSTPGRSPPRE